MVLGILHIRASVVLTTLRLGLLGLHICALSCADTLVILGEVGDADDCDCCPYAMLADKTVANTIITR